MVQGQGGEWLLYLRLSRGRAGVGRQRRVTAAWIAEQGGTIVAEFKDTDSTAYRGLGEARPKRDDFDAMLGLLRSRPGLNVAAWHADRLVRDLEDAETLLVASDRARGIIGTPAGGIYDPATSNGRKRLLQDALDARSEVDHMRERIVLHKNEAKGEGMWLGGPRPFGWDRVPRLDKDEPPELRLNPAEADLIRSGALAILNGASLRSVTAAWNASGITGSRGGAWANREVSGVLRRARNAGLAEHDLGDGKGLQVTGAGRWPPIITEDQWRDCKTILEGPGRRTAFSTQPAHLLSGIAVCGVCQTPVVATSANRGKGRPAQVTYRDRPKEGKGHVARAGAPLDHYISEAVIAYVEKHGQKALQPPAPDTAPLAAQLKAAETELAALDAARRDESITVMQAIQWAKPVNKRAAELRERIAAAAAARGPASVFTEADIRAGWERAPLDSKRAVIRALMTITILPVPAGQHGCPPGWRRGDGPYFRPELVKVEWKRERS